MEQELPDLDTELAASLEAIPEEYLPTNVLDFDDLPASRDQAAQLSEMMLAEAPAFPEVESEDVTVPGPTDDQELPLRIYRPVEAEPGLPGIYWIHGGGMVMGGLDQEDPNCERFVDELNCVVVSVDYRLAPEHPYPAPVDDCHAGLEWVAENAADVGIDSSRLAIAGPSAGGGLSAAVALRARDEGGPELRYQMLIYPMLDDRNITESSKQITDIGIWDRGTNRQAWDAYLGDLSASDELPPDAAPGRVADLSGLPPTFIDVGTHDVFRDESKSYAERLTNGGVPTEFHLWPGAYHGYDGLAPDAQLAQETWETRLAALGRALTE
ncbi:MAG: alpha/beta hydrolase [Halolamina sp.]|uniref:alpha/beta hydrolase n=1 Tax=Halolamina sp. TaxID=1940283 RepID=UPI002FC36724